MTFTETIEAQVVGIGKSKIPESEKAVLRLLYRKWNEGSEKVMQKDIAEIIPFLGSHEVYDQKSDESTLRQVRQIIRDLRIKRFAPILSDANGYWLPKSEDEACKYLERVEQEVKSRAAAGFETYRSMKESLGISSTYFEGQGKLLEDKPLVNDVESSNASNSPYKVYRIVGLEEQPYICNCPSFKYRKSCRHIDEIKNKK